MSSKSPPLTVGELGAEACCALGAIPHDPRRTLAVSAAAVCAVLLLRALWPSLVPSFDRAFALRLDACAVPVALSAQGQETLGCISDVPAGARVPYAPHAWRYARLVQSTGGADARGNFLHLEALGMSQSLRLALGEPVDLQRVDARTLALVSGMTPRLAQALVAYRSAHGPITTLRALRAVPGFGPRKLAQLARAVELGPVRPCAAPAVCDAAGGCRGSPGWPGRARR